MHGSIETAGGSPYRTAEEFLCAKREARLEELAAEGAHVSDDLRRVYGRRVARSVAGATATLCAFVVAVAAASRAGTPALEGHEPHPSLTALLLGTVAVTPLAYLAARVFAAWHLPRAMAQSFERTRDVHRDLERLARFDNAHRAASLAEAWERKSVAWPLVGSALVAPLSLHMPVAWMLTAPAGDFFADYDRWILVSLAIVGHAHLVLAFMGLHFARKLARLRGDAARGIGGGRALLAACAAGAVPGIVFFLIPPILVAVTGAVFVPASYAYLRNTVLDERKDLTIPARPV